MSLLDHKADALFVKIFSDKKNQDCLLDFLNSILKPESPIMKASFDMKSEKGVFRRDFSVIYIISGENAKGCPVEVSLTLGMGEKMIPPWRRSFLRMVLGNTVVEGHNEHPLHLYGLMLMDEHHQMSDHHHESAVVEIERMEDEFGPFLREQKFHVFALEKFQLKNPLESQELWLAFLKDPKNPALLEAKQKSNALEKAMTLAQK